MTDESTCDCGAAATGMDELIAELREHERDYPSLIHAELCGRAADEIERLRAQLAAMRAALLRAQLAAMRAALEAARDWIVENTNGEHDPDDGIMYERGWWPADDRLMKQINATLTPPDDAK